MKYPTILTPDSLTVMVNGQSVSILKENANFEKAVDALRSQRWDKLIALMNKAEAINQYGNGRITVEDGCVYFEDEEIKGHIVDRILMFIRDGLDATPLMNFLDKIMDNPSRRCVQQLFSFLEHGNMPIDEDGDFYAYKAVTCDFKDKHTQKLDNSPGCIVKVQRNTVDDDPSNECSFGLHAGSLSYVKAFASWNDIITIVKINPKDVVSVPNHDKSKLRCCQYKVIEEYNGPLPETTYENMSSSEDVREINWTDNPTPVIPISMPMLDPDKYKDIEDDFESKYCQECGWELDDCRCCEDCGKFFCECEDKNIEDDDEDYSW